MPLRPSLLDPLFAPVTALGGVGPKLSPLFDRLLGPADGGPARVLDVLLHLPTGTISRELKGSIVDAPIGEPVTVAVRVATHRAPPPRGRGPYRVLVEDDTGDITLVFFNGHPQRLSKLLPVGEKRFVSGTIELFDGMRQMIHPARVMDEAEAERSSTSEAIYGQTEGLTSRLIAKVAGAALARLPDLPEWQDAAWLARNGFPPFARALAAQHAPDRPPPAEDGVADPTRRRLAYDELLASQLALALVRNRSRRQPGRDNAGDGRIVQRLLAALPFRPTGAQTRALDEIGADLKTPHRMLRLLQGDVGSGKTLVALLAMASVIEAGRQAALVAPTEILARQHHERLVGLAAGSGLRIGVATGRDRPAERRATLEALAAGHLDIVVGTHALMGDEIVFRDLALAVVDEQHRFGVHQRLALGRKGEAVDMLVMTATPIPRTLALGYFGDMDMSVLDEKPPGRKPIDTRLIPLGRLGDVVDAVRRAVDADTLVYWVCPLVAEAETLDLAAAEERFEALREVFGDAVGLVHGRMNARDKDSTMAAFGSGQIKVLVSTTVIEVGVDVPRATVMVVEHAERFGLAQLHQLRGRIGRGDKASTCLLVYKGPLGETAKARLETMRRTEDGFAIAEEDLRLRGEGEILGTRQSGLPGFRIARPDGDGDLLLAARDDARLIVERDPELESPRGEALRLLLYLFERDAGVRTLRAG